MDTLVSNLTCLFNYEIDKCECKQYYSLWYLTFRHKHVMALKLGTDLICHATSCFNLEFPSVHCQLQSLDQKNIAQQFFFCFEPIKKHELELETSQTIGNIDSNLMSMVGEKMVSDKNQSVFCCAPTLFTKSAYVCNKEFYWPLRGNWFS